MYALGLGVKVVVNAVAMQFLSSTQLSETPWTVACQAPLSKGLPKQEY